MYGIIILAPLACIIVSLCIGRFPLSLADITHVLWSKAAPGGCTVPDSHMNIVWDIRLPRAILGALVGACLAVSGTAFQGLFRNPLVSSGILGVSSGAGFGAALGILL
ncbi:MAG: iron chelate uptake ABC transporter family permease subunit, partial [Deltaproteobacteria bacterium]|nr:iron chelate uptake ABC transporter family permease subunit [Deltaproteobacteria bacterium]